MDEGDTTESSKRWDNFLIELQPQQLVQIAFLGAVVGIIFWLLTLLLQQILTPIFCDASVDGSCGAATSVSDIIATIFAGVAGLLGLVRVGVYRPLLIAVAVALALWGFGGWINGLPWFTAVAWSVVLYALTYMLFAWIVRIRAFLPAIVTITVVIVLARWLAVL